MLQEIGILEQVMEEAVWALGDESCSILNQVQRPEHLVVHFLIRKRAVGVVRCGLHFRVRFCHTSQRGRNAGRQTMTTVNHSVSSVQVRKYIDQEMRSEINQLPPFEDGLALNVIRNEARRYKCGCHCLWGSLDTHVSSAACEERCSCDTQHCFRAEPMLQPWGFTMCEEAARQAGT